MKNIFRAESSGSNGEISTVELENEIKTVTDIEGYLEKNRPHMLSDTLPEHLKNLLAQKGVSRADVVRDSMLNRTYVYQIFDGSKMPSRDKLIAIAFGLHLSDEETQKMLKLSGYRKLYARDDRDAILLFALHRGKSIFEANDLLFEHDFPALGVPKE